MLYILISEKKGATLIKFGGEIGKTRDCLHTPLLFFLSLSILCENPDLRQGRILRFSKVGWGGGGGGGALDIFFREAL